MVRPDDWSQLLLPFEGEDWSGCTSPAGASPVPVGVGAPGSRPQAPGETPVAHAGCRKPLRREQARGPQHQVNVAASSDEQWESRAAHFTAKTTPGAPDPKRAQGLPGVGTVARVQGEVRNRRGPSAPPESGRGVSNKPKVKSTTVQRESEGVVGPKNSVRALQCPFRRTFEHRTLSRLTRPDTARMIPGCRISLCS